MKAKPITAESTHASELSDAALLDIFGGSTGYAPTADAGATATVHVVIDVSSDSDPAGYHAASPVVAHTAGPISQAPVTAIPAHTTPIPAAQTPGHTTAAPVVPQVPNHTTAVTPSAATGAKLPAPGDHTVPVVPTTTTNHQQPTNASRDHSDHDGHHGSLREAFDAAHDRFHDALDHAHDGLDHLVDGAAEMAVAAVELNPVVAGLRFLHDARHPSATKKP